MNIDRAEKLKGEAVFVDAHNHIMIELAYRRNHGERAVFKNFLAPHIKRGGVDVVMMVVGGDSRNFIEGTDLMLWGTLRAVEMLLQDIEESADVVALCRTVAEIEAAGKEGKLAVLMTLEGGRPLEGRPNYDSLEPLQILYRLGLRQMQLVDLGRNRLADGTYTARADSKLTPFGIEVVRECNRLGIIVDVAHLPDRGFYDLLEHSSDPVIDTHSNAKAVSGAVRNLTDERIDAMAQQGGIIGISFFDALVNKEAVDRGDRPVLDDIVRHVDYLVERAGIDYVGFGPDHCEFPSIIDHGWCPVIGFHEGVHVGVRESYSTPEVDSVEKLPKLTAALIDRGYSDEQIKKLLGENFLRVYRQILGG